MREKETKKGMKTFLQDTNAVSEVIGFVLIMGILLSATSIYFSQQIPIWTEDYEARHAEDVVDDFSELDSLVDGVVLVAKQEGETPAGATKSIKMSPDRVPLFGMSPPGASISFSPHAEELFAILPYVGDGSPPAGDPENGTIEESTTADFSHANATRVNVDVSFDSIKLSRIALSGDLILTNTITTLGGEYQYATVSITNNSIVYLVPGYYLKLYANTIYIDASSAIIGDARGYLGGTAGRIGNGPGFGSYESPAYNGSGGGGAGYAGVGGDGGWGGAASLGDVGTGGVNYSDNTSSAFDFGSGGGGGGYGEAFHANPYDGDAGGDGGNGGGAVLLCAPTITITCNITVDGGNGMAGAESKEKGGGGGGGGSGGTIIIQGYEVNLSSATLSVHGGAGGDGGDGKNPGVGGGGGGGGAGGRIKIFYDNVSLYDNTTLNCSMGGGTRGENGDLNTNPIGVNGSDGCFYENQTTYISTVPHYTQGYYESRVYNTNYTTTCYGDMTWDATTSEYTSLVLKVRTSISPNMTGAALWENCPAVANGQDISELSSAFDRHRYIQYRAELFTYEPATTPVLDWVRINYSSHCLAGEGGGGGIVDSATGIIKFRSSYIYYPNQEVVYEHGAVIRAQTVDNVKRGFVITDPPIMIGTDNATGAPLLQISMIDLTGSNYSYAGSRSSSVETSSDNDDGDAYTHLAGTIAFENLSLSLTTAYPSIWSSWFNEKLAESGLNAPDDYKPPEINESAGTVVVAFYGQPGVGVLLYEEKTKIAVDIKT